MAGRRRALIVASDEYENPGLSRLRAPAADAEALAKVLGDKDIGDFHVQVVHNEPAHVVGGRIEDLFADSQSDDLLLLHFSGHGLKNDSGELFFAARNTRPDRLASTAVPADFVQRCMPTSRARSIVLFLDCCYGGAFGEGVALRAAGSANVLESFPTGRLGGGRGRAVITASSAMEYAFEGNTLADDHQQQPSVFTSALVEGLTSGEADRDEDGLVSLNELYDFVYDRVRERNPKQTPGRDVELEGDLYLARSQRRRLRPIPIPPDVDAALKSDNMFTRLGAVAELRARLGSSDLGAALGAFQALTEVSRSDIRYVQDAAAEALGTAALTLDPPELHFGTVSSTDLPVTRTIRLTGPPLAIAVSVAQAGAWVTAKVEGAEVRVSADTTMTGPLTGTVTVTGPTGQVVVPVTAEVAPPASETDDQPMETDDRPMETEPLRSWPPTGRRPLLTRTSPLEPPRCRFARPRNRRRRSRHHRSRPHRRRGTGSGAVLPRWSRAASCCCPSCCRSTGGPYLRGGSHQGDVSVLPRAHHCRDGSSCPACSVAEPRTGCAHRSLGRRHRGALRHGQHFPRHRKCRCRGCFPSRLRRPARPSRRRRLRRRGDPAGVGPEVCRLLALRPGQVARPRGRGPRGPGPPSPGAGPVQR